MTDHDPRAADVLENLFFFGLPDTALESIDAILDALAAAGLVVRPADDEYVLPQHMTDPTLTAVLYGDDDSLEWTGAPQLAWGPVAVPLYVRKENPDD